MGTRRATGELVLQVGRGGRSPCKRKARSRDWTKAKERRFLEELGATCNVSLAAERAKVGSTTVYSRRRKDAAFRLAWSEAVAQAYARLEVETLERALAGKTRTIVAKDGSEERVIEYDERTALALLRLHRDNAREPERREVAESAISVDEANEVRDRLLAKIKRVRVRLLGQAAGETDGWDAVGKDGTLALTGPASVSDAE